MTHIATTTWSDFSAQQVAGLLSAGFEQHTGTGVDSTVVDCAGAQFVGQLADYFHADQSNPGVWLGRDPDTNETVVSLELNTLIDLAGSTATVGERLRQAHTELGATKILLLNGSESVNDFGAGMFDAAAQFCQVPGQRLILVADEQKSYFAAHKTERTEWATKVTERIGQDAVNSALGQPGVGAAAGLGFTVKALGGQITSPADAMAVATNLANKLAAAELLIVAVEVFDHRSLRNSPVTAAVDAAGTWGIPVVVVAGAVEVGRRELSAVGVSAAYAVSDQVLSPTGELTEAITPERITERVVAVARTWCRSVN